MLSRELPEGTHSLEKRYQTRFWRGTAGALEAARDAVGAAEGHSLEKHYQTSFSLKDYVLLIDC